ncbi:subtilase-type protease inhibitor [Streptomyces sp. ISL-22]|uniref:subtilase-type protease inhibitor n=1 Tax=unclassified Streptomyces TaxID=2593676 RepID=UPI001BE8BB76|nr:MULTISPECIES: subtilase-type protease inhibitor [unclassified Streptomyces]MBT2416853.1 subtilase-type protease inhibitor [Streptomyces sp. ISL-24]MBT2436142.1 subtilase-type protease inhibitor [Streptomyces sp. ISL-22]
MRNTARWAATLGLTATAVCGPLTGSVLAAPDAAPASLYAPSALVLTVAYGDTATMATPVRAVTLSCAPTPSGTHPAASSACAELRGVNGNMDALKSQSGMLCTKQYDPVLVTVDGVWQGQRVSYERTFSNECVKSSYTSSLFAF